MRLCLLLLLAAPVDAKPRADACTESSQCQLLPKSCCGHCGNPTETDVRALNTDWLEEHGRPGCQEAQGCPDCFDKSAHQMVAVCEKKTCTALKLDRTPLTKCTRDDECAMITVGCCGGAPVAVRKDRAAALWERMCHAVGCGKSVQPPLPVPICRNGRCAVP